MAEINPRAIGPFPAEWPTGAARLIIALLPTQLAAGTAPAQTRHLITTLGILGSVWSGIAGALVTLRVASAHVGLAVAELSLALAGAVLVAICGRLPAGPRRKLPPYPEGHGTPRRHQPASVPARLGLLTSPGLAGRRPMSR